MDECKIILNGHNNMLFASKYCSQEQVDRIEKLANFIFSHPEFLDETSEIFKTCHNDVLFQTAFSDLIDLHQKDFDPTLFEAYKKLLNDFYVNSTDVDNQRGNVLEKLAELAITKKYNSLDGAEIKFHCKIELIYNKITFTVSPKNIDACGTIKTNGDYLECKIGLRGDNENDREKMNIIASLSKHFKEIGKLFSQTHDVFTLTFTNNPKKLDYYQKTWPEVNFLSIDNFNSRYCSN